MKRMLLAGLAAASLTLVAHGAEPLNPAQFVAKASEAGMAEVELGKLAAQKGNAAEIKAYGQRMVADHTMAGTELDQIAMQKGLQASKALNPEHTKALEDLRAKSGEDFDAAYASQMVKDHEAAVALFESASKLPDQQLAQYASRTLPVLREHREHAGHLDAGN